jgi:hypothetical protein
LQQILLRQTNISDEVRALFERHSLQKTRPTVGQLSTLLQSESRPLSKFFIVIDALDECHSDKTACNLLEDLQTLGPAMRLLVTARPHIISVKQRYEDAVVLKIRADDEDIKKFLQGQIEKEPKLKTRITKDPALGVLIKTTIVQKVKGMYVPIYLFSLIR